MNIKQERGAKSLFLFFLYSCILKEVPVFRETENRQQTGKEIHKCVCRNMRDIGLEMGSHNASAGTKTAVRLPIPASPFNV